MDDDKKPPTRKSYPEVTETIKTIWRTWKSGWRSASAGRRDGISALNRTGSKRRAIIVGSGELGLVVQDWPPELLAESDIISVNFSYLNGIRPDILFFESTQSADMNRLFFQHLKDSSFLQDTRVTINLHHWRMHSNEVPDVDLSELHGHSVMFFTCDDLDRFARLYRLIRFRLNLKMPVHHATHIFAAIDWAIYQKYEEVVIAGVDLNGGPYFSTSSMLRIQSEEHGNALQIYERCRTDLERRMGYRIDVHPSTDVKFAKRYSQLPALQVFEALAKVVSTERNAPKVYTAHKDSALAAYFPVFEA